MKQLFRIITTSIAAMLLLCGSPGTATAQSRELIINLASLDGVPLTPENIFSFGIQSAFSSATNATVKGTVRYKQSGLSFSYSFNTILRGGMNMIEGGAIHPAWTWSSNALRELFQDYHTLPEGTYEYCVTIMPLNQAGEPGVSGETTECIYGKKEDLFLINLVDPENNAKIYEYYPVFSWIVNYPFASQLTYRIRIAEIKEGQNTVNAITRNNPIYQESNLPQTTATYPVYASPLKPFQPYAWTVDAYYKGILLGGAEQWKFTIIEDSEMLAVPANPSYVEVNLEKGMSKIYAVGQLKLKYIERDRITDSLKLELLDSKGNRIVLKSNSWLAKRGDNRLIIPLEETGLKHLKYYKITITSSSQQYIILFQYVNPIYLRKNNE